MIGNNEQRFRELLGSVNQLPCWHVSCGGAVGSSFQLALGQKIPRNIPGTNPNHPEAFRLFEGEANLLVWCSWRLDGPQGPLTSSDDSLENITGFLPKLQGEKLFRIIADSPGWDATLPFSEGFKLHLFCDRVGDASFDGNWEIWTQDLAAFVGKGSQLEFEERKEAVTSR